MPISKRFEFGYKRKLDNDRRKKCCQSCPNMTDLIRCKKLELNPEVEETCSDPGKGIKTGKPCLNPTQPSSVAVSSGTSKRKYINPFSVSSKKKELSGGMKRVIVDSWGKMWQSFLSDLQFDRIVFENNPDAEQTYKNDEERINDGCRKLWMITKMNQNITTMMIRKFISGPANKLYTLNRIEAVQCWNRILDEEGYVKDECCVDLPPANKRTLDIPSLIKSPRFARSNNPDRSRKSNAYKLPETIASEIAARKWLEHGGTCYADSEDSPFKKNKTYWLDPYLVPPVDETFKEEEFELSPMEDPTGETRRELSKLKEIAKRYMRFAKQIEKSRYVVGRAEKMKKMLQETVGEEGEKRQTLLHKSRVSMDFRRDVLLATLSRADQLNKNLSDETPYPYTLAEGSKARLKYRQTEQKISK